jgi:hypothetical protein
MHCRRMESIKRCRTETSQQKRSYNQSKRLHVPLCETCASTANAGLNHQQLDSPSIWGRDHQDFPPGDEWGKG